MRPRLQWRNFVETSDIILQGGGEHARVVLDCLLAQKKNVLALFDPKYHDSLFGIQQRGMYDPYFAPEALAIIAIGDNALRKKVAAMTSHQFTNAIHPTTIISPFTSLGKGCMILHGSIVQAQSSIGNHVIVNTGAKVDHDCKLEDFVHIGPGAILCGTVGVGEGSFLGAGSVILPGKKIGRWATIGAGTIVTQDVPDGVTVVGNPGKIIKYQNS
jgi:sugar O-acyltransferase (sialic acid O-acetyltransferase NeuD family)